MKKTFAVFLSLAMLLSVWGTVLAEGEEKNPAPEFERPVFISVADDSGAQVNDAVLQLSDSEGNIVEVWNAGDDRLFFLGEGEYTITNLTVSDDYMEEAEPVVLTVERTAEEQAAFTGSVRYDHDHGAICNNAQHIGLELYTVTGNGNSVAAYCFNHGKKNPTGESNYREYIATPELLYRYARNKNDAISAQELYDHVLSVIYRSPEVQSAHGLDDDEIRYLAYMAIKNFTDPKCFVEFDENGNSLVMRNENGTPIRDENGNYVFYEGGCVLGAIIHHGNADHKNQADYVFPQKYIDAYHDLIGSTEHPSDYCLYFYYPDNYVIGDNNSYQILLSAKRVTPEDTTLTVRSAVQFTVGMVWAIEDSEAVCPTPEEVADRLQIFADEEEITEQYRDAVEVVDNLDGTYTVLLHKLPKLNDEGEEIVYTMSFSGIENFLMDKHVVMNGETVEFTPLKLKILRFKRLPIKPIKP